MNDPWSVAGKIVETIDSLHGVAALREEIARLKALNAKQAGEIAKKTAEISNLRKAQTRGGQDEEVRDLREELRFKSIEIRELKASLEHKDKAAIQISKNNATLRDQVEHQRKAYKELYGLYIKARDTLDEVRRALSIHEED